MVDGEGYSYRFRPKDIGAKPLGAAEIHEERPPRRGGVYIDWGPEPPRKYPRDRMAAYIRDPFWVCVHWFLEGSRSSRWRNRLGCEPEYILIIESPDSARYEYVIPRECPFWWIRVEPGRSYSARVLIRVPGKTIEICRTRSFKTPTPWVKQKPSGLSPAAKTLVDRFGYYVCAADEQIPAKFALGTFMTGAAPMPGLAIGTTGYPPFNSPLPSSGR
ncbi:MAG: hypothetical protein WC712_06070 [Candidatus Brocadiia bacterium]